RLSKRLSPGVLGRRSCGALGCRRVCGRGHCINGESVQAQAAFRGESGAGEPAFVGRNCRRYRALLRARDRRAAMRLGRPELRIVAPGLAGAGALGGLIGVGTVAGTPLLPAGILLGLAGLLTTLRSPLAAVF